MKAMLFSEFGLSAELQKAVQRLGFEQASPIQAAAIPVLMAGRDVVGQSHTGSGKTAAFAIPAIERLDPKGPGPQALIICPTRELAMQVCEEVHKLSFFKKGVRAVPIYGGQSYERQFSELRAGAQIVVGTPGRLLDHLRRGTLTVANIKTVILDEADEMLDMGFRDDIEALLKGVPDGRQTVLFSATIPRGIEDLIGRYTKNPERLHIAASSLTVPTIEQVVFEVDRRWKFEALTRLLDLHDVTLGIVFANTQRDVIELADHLVGSGYSAECIHGGMPQAARERVMNRFRGGNIRLLVATDVAARGIDVDDVQVVFNFELPYDPEDYVHRIGRTGRAGRHGMAMSLAGGRELFLLRDIERLTRQRLRRGKLAIDVRRLGVDFLSLSAHKLHAPNGVGMLYTKRRTKFQPYLIGGHQERGRRGGTESVANIVAFGRAAELAMATLHDENTRVRGLRDRLETWILSNIPNTVRNGGKEPRLPNTANVAFDFVEAEAVLMLLDQVGICCSSGSA